MVIGVSPKGTLKTAGARHNSAFNQKSAEEEIEKTRQ
jgi:hypothetical protein